ncbi:DUF4179 domain-containing protein [Clostridium sp. MB40-C1]|uniref:DUF4179 domain-containing protein n=1 Tax=Clostridium sp. MB40-C1 TaxID=3070996 RepID=UPI0027DEFD9E|nr:DUF4179 domain-containing protein [Clostridium sp. MB40-C1]WMJ79364.1 DUF4179 domain-containing protein [Clostridium sp. MB40-C1]
MKQEEIKRVLKSKKRDIDDLKVPEELEERLRGALKNISLKNNNIVQQNQNNDNKQLKNKSLKNKVRQNWIGKVAAVIIAVILFGYNIDGLAFYGKKIIGYDEVMNDTLKKLNELGKGQSIDKSYAFKNGATVTLDGVMIDDNKLLVFYTIKSSKGNVDKLNIESAKIIEGSKNNIYMKSSEGLLNDSKTEIKYKIEFEKPNLNEEELKWSFTLTEGKYKEIGNIVFNLDKSKAMTHTLKKNINQSIKVDETKIRFNSIEASPTSTFIKGTIQDIFELAIDEVLGGGFRPSSMEIKLIANGKEVEWQGAGSSTNINGMTFQQEYDALPVPIKTLQIKLVNFEADHRVNKKVELKKDDMKNLIEVLGQKIQIDKMYEEKGDTYVTITTKEDVLLSKVYMIMDGKKVRLEETIYNKENIKKKENYKNKDNDEEVKEKYNNKDNSEEMKEKHNNYNESDAKYKDGTKSNTRTLRFEGTGENLQLQIKGLRYNKVYNKVIDVKVD